MIGRGTWFQKLFGFREAGYSSTKQQFEYDPTLGTLKSKAKPERVFIAGRFETPSLEELRARVDLGAAREALGNKRIRVCEVVDDASLIHSKPDNSGALFQAASQFNALEHASQHGTPEDGITCYSSDKTQGPACATACAAGTVVRNYFAFSSSEGQTKDRQVQNLGQVEALLNNGKEQYFQVMNGYTMASNTSLQKLTEVIAGSARLQEDIRKKIRIGVQAETEVLTSSFGAEIYDGPQQLATQVYGSAISVSYSRCRSENWELFARLVLESAYESTLYAAVENYMRNPEKPGSRKVFLTALGGGVFGNDMEWIKDAMSKSFTKFQDIGLEIHLVSFRFSTREFVQLQREFDPRKPFDAPSKAFSTRL